MENNINELQKFGFEVIERLFRNKLNETINDEYLCNTYVKIKFKVDTSYLIIDFLEFIKEEFQKEAKIIMDNIVQEYADKYRLHYKKINYHPIFGRSRSFG